MLFSSDVDPDPVRSAFFCPGTGLDPDSDPHSLSLMDPDPHKIKPDPHPCYIQTVNNKIIIPNNLVRKLT